MISKKLGEQVIFAQRIYTVIVKYTPFGKIMKELGQEPADFIPDTFAGN